MGEQLDLEDWIVARTRKVALCVACDGTGESTKGGPCVPCSGTGRKKKKTMGEPGLLGVLAEVREELRENDVVVNADEFLHNSDSAASPRPKKSRKRRCPLDDEVVVDGRFRVEHVRRDARKLVTCVAMKGAAGWVNTPALSAPPGSLVRVQAAPGATADDVEVCVSECSKSAAAVRTVAATGASDETVAVGTPENPIKPACDVRAAALELCEKSSYHDRPVLRKLVERMLDEVGA